MKTAGFRGQRGFTVMELLVLIAVLGMMAAIIIPNVTSFIATGQLAGARDELTAVRVAAAGYYVRYGSWPGDTTIPELKEYYTRDLKAVYYFDTTDDGAGVGIGLIQNAVPVAGGWKGLRWVSPEQTWEKQ